MAAMVGARAGICMMAVPTRILVVFAKSQAAEVMASEPYASAVQHESKPSRSASRTISIGGSSFRPE